jgi:WD40 repeat protein
MYWSLHDNNILCSFVGHTEQITHLDLNPLNSTFVSCSKDGTSRVWEYEKKQCLIRIAKTKAACFDNTGNVLACVYVKDEKGTVSSEGGATNVQQQIHLFNASNYESVRQNLYEYFRGPLASSTWRTHRRSSS